MNNSAVWEFTRDKVTEIANSIRPSTPRWKAVTSLIAGIRDDDRFGEVWDAVSNEIHFLEMEEAERRARTYRRRRARS